MKCEEEWWLIFLMFLECEGVLEQYEENLDEYFYKCVHYKNQFLTQAFEWAETKQGGRFWFQLETKWWNLRNRLLDA